MVKSVLAMGVNVDFILSGMGRLWRVLLLFACLFNVARCGYIINVQSCFLWCFI